VQWSYHFDRNFRQKLLYARNEVEQGVDVWQSLSDAKLLSVPESYAVASAPSNRVRAWILRRLASVKQSAVRRRIATLFAFLEPIVVLCFGALVLWICFAFISFIARLTSLLA
jgi:general secretion pathway protein F